MVMLHSYLFSPHAVVLTTVTAGVIIAAIKLHIFKTRQQSPDVGMQIQGGYEIFNDDDDDDDDQGVAKNPIYFNA